MTRVIVVRLKEGSIRVHNITIMTNSMIKTPVVNIAGFPFPDDCPGFGVITLFNQNKQITDKLTIMSMILFLIIISPDI